MNLRSVLKLAVLAIPMCLMLAAQDAPRLSIVIVEGDGSINNVKQRTSRETIVEVQDENHRPVAGAAVVFLLPNSGPGGVFTGGSNSAAVTTDSAGRATMPKFQPNQATGNYQIRVNATSAGRQASTTIAQTNAAGAAGAGAAGTAAAHGISGKTIGIIIAVVAAGGAAAAAVALNGNNKTTTPGTPTPTTPTGTITAGAGVTFGPPQ